MQLIDSTIPGLEGYYPKSLHHFEETSIFLGRSQGKEVVVVQGQGDLFDQVKGDLVDEKTKIGPCSTENRLVLNHFFPFTTPQAFGREIATLGLGDRLGLAGDGHLEALADRAVRPILAQQSIRELDLTNRTFEQVIDAAAYAVFRNDYQKGYGADGDHLKLEKDIEYALSVGMSMLTLDCSDYIDNDVPNLDTNELAQRYAALDADLRNRLEETYLGKSFDFETFSITFDQAELTYQAVQYAGALDYTTHVFHHYVKNLDRPIDFELSIDETMTVTSPAAHFFVANELAARQVQVTSLAPRFVGEFQKGIDYIGKVEEFTVDFRQHAEIARHFGYKVSVHSGSDKFSVFPVVAEETRGLFHVKTAGTNWLEALAVVAETDPDLFRRIFVFAQDHFAIAQAYYHITPDLDQIAPLDRVSDSDLPNYLKDANARQLLHVTYGLILTDKDAEGHYTLREDFFSLLDEHASLYASHLSQHIGKHLDLLAIGKES